MLIMLSLTQELDSLITQDRTDLSIIVRNFENRSRRGTIVKVLDKLVYRYVFRRSVEELVLELCKLDTMEQWERWVDAIEETKDIQGWISSVHKYNEAWSDVRSFPRILPLWIGEVDTDL